MIRLALVTGATSGLGEALSDLLSKRGIPLLITGRDKNRLKTVADQCNAASLAIDLSQTKTPLLDWIRQHQPDLVINNAGFGLYGPVLMHPTKSQMEILEVNGAAAMEISIEAARSLLIHQKKGVIVNVSSAAGQLPIPTMAVYAASKSLLTTFSQSFDAEMRPLGIRILASLPGPIATCFAEQASLGHFKRTSSWNTLSPSRAAELIWNQIERKKGVQIIDFRTRIISILAGFLPRRVTNWALCKNLSKRYKSTL